MKKGNLMTKAEMKKVLGGVEYQEGGDDTGTCNGICVLNGTDCPKVTPDLARSSVICQDKEKCCVGR